MTKCEPATEEHIHYETDLLQEEYMVEVPTTYIETVTKRVPKLVEQTRVVNRAYEIEVPVEKVHQTANDVIVPGNAVEYEHSHEYGSEHHVHGAPKPT